MYAWLKASVALVFCISCCCWSLLYSATLCSQADSQCSHVILHERIAFYSAILNIHCSGVLTVVNVVNNCKELCELFWIRALHKCYLLLLLKMAWQHEKATPTEPSAAARHTPPTDLSAGCLRAALMKRLCSASCSLNCSSRHRWRTQSKHNTSSL